MRFLISLLICLCIFTFSCKKTTVNNLISEGTYAGTFQRLTSTGGDISKVTIIFKANSWTGESQFAKYPALCQGTYKSERVGNIIFENACAWTAEFDWTLILSGNYNLKVFGKQVEILRNYNNGSKDIYILTKQ